jgi:cytochrome c-type biogenesis protein CcmE
VSLPLEEDDLPPLPPPGAARRARDRSTRRRLLVVGAVLAAAVGFLLYKGLTTAVVFFKTANEAIAQRHVLGDATFQIEGVVVPGTVHRLGPAELAFEIESKGVKVQVHDEGSPPQLFEPGIPVVLVGHFVGSSDLFSSDEIMVKHSNVYVAAHPAQGRRADGSLR